MIVKSRKLLEGSVENGEPLARYIFSKKHITADGRIKGPAFKPPSGQHRASVIRYKDCSKACLLKIGKGIEKNRGNSLKAISSLLAEDVRTLQNLDVQPDVSRGQHRRHANIVGFNNFDSAKIKHYANKLANKAVLLLRA